MSYSSLSLPAALACRRAVPRLRGFDQPTRKRPHHGEAEFVVFSQEVAEQIARQPEDQQVRRGGHRGAARLVQQQRCLAHDLARPEPGDDRPPAAAADRHLRDAFEDEKAALPRLAGTIERWWPAVLVALTTGITNARTEGFNRIIKQTKRVGCGFRNMINYQRRILAHIAVTRPRWSAA